jgi:hypothetical protein
VAQKLHEQYNYSYDNLKVLLGGWSTYKDHNTTDPAGYPIETGATTGTTPDAGKVQITPSTVITP